MGRSTCLPLFFAKKKQNHLVNFLLRDSLLIPPLILSGLKYKDSKMARKAGCEFCYLIVPSSTRSPNNPIFKLTNTGNYQAYLYQRPDQYKMKILVLSIQYDFQVLKYQYRYSILRILNKYHSTVVLQIRSSKSKSDIFKDPARYFSISFYTQC